APAIRPRCPAVLPGPAARGWRGRDGGRRPGPLPVRPSPSGGPGGGRLGGRAPPARGGLGDRPETTLRVARPAGSLQRVVAFGGHEQRRIRTTAARRQSAYG